MRKSLFLAALVLISAGCFAQKNPATKKAKGYMLADTPDFVAARAAIDEALKTEPTAETYYWAGMIGYKEAQREDYNQVMGMNADQAKAGAATIESIKYWLKADELAQVPVLNKKGEQVPTDPKMRAKLAKLMLEYYKGNEYIGMGELVRYGSYLNDQRDFAGAFNAFKMHISIPDLPMMQDPKIQKEMPRDTTYEQYRYYTAIFAVQAEMHDEAIAMLEALKNGNHEPISVNQFLYQEYVAINDTAKFVETLQNASVRFPQEPWFIQNLINYYIFSGQEQAAVDYLSQAIAREPNVAQYHLIKGNLNVNLGNFDAAMVDFDNALAVDPTLADAVAGKGRVYYNQAVKLNEDAALISDNKAYKQADEQMKAVFRQSLPYFEKAHEMDPNELQYLQILKGLYYRFRTEPGMQAKYDATVEKLNNL